MLKRIKFWLKYITLMEALGFTSFDFRKSIQWSPFLSYDVAHLFHNDYTFGVLYVTSQGWMYSQPFRQTIIHTYCLIFHMAQVSRFVHWKSRQQNMELSRSEYVASWNWLSDFETEKDSMYTHSTISRNWNLKWSAQELNINTLLLRVKSHLWFAE